MTAKDRTLEIIQASIYADPMMDAVQDVKQALKELEPVEAAILVGVAAGVPIQIYREYGFWKVTEIIRDASEKFLEILSETYA